MEQFDWRFKCFSLIRWPRNTVLRFLMSGPYLLRVIVCLSSPFVLISAGISNCKWLLKESWIGRSRTSIPNYSSLGWPTSSDITSSQPSSSILTIATSVKRQHSAHICTFFLLGSYKILVSQRCTTMPISFYFSNHMSLRISMNIFIDPRSGAQMLKLYSIDRSNEHIS